LISTKVSFKNYVTVSNNYASWEQRTGKKTKREILLIGNNDGRIGVVDCETLTYFNDNSEHILPGYTLDEVNVGGPISILDVSRTGVLASLSREKSSNTGNGIRTSSNDAIKTWNIECSTNTFEEGESGLPAECYNHKPTFRIIFKHKSTYRSDRCALACCWDVLQTDTLIIGGFDGILSRWNTNKSVQCLGLGFNNNSSGGNGNGNSSSKSKRKRGANHGMKKKVTTVTKQETTPKLEAEANDLVELKETPVKPVKESNTIAKEEPKTEQKPSLKKWDDAGEASKNSCKTSSVIIDKFPHLKKVLETVEDKELKTSIEQALELDAKELF